MDIATSTRSFSTKVVVVDGSREDHIFTWWVENFEWRTDSEVQKVTEDYPMTTSDINAQIVTGDNQERKSIWTLYLYVSYAKDICGKETVPCLSIHLDYSKMNKAVSQIMGTISILTSDDTRANPRAFQYIHGKPWVLDQLEFFMVRDDLEKDPEKFLRNGTLTILCEMRIWYNSLTEFGPFGSTYFAKLDKDKVISDLKHLLQNKKCYDVTLRCSDSELKAHKAILSARSPVFAAMFEHEATEILTNHVNIRDISSCVMEKLLGFMYGRDLDNTLTMKICLELYSAADKYEILELKEICAHLLSLNMNVENICKVSVKAYLHQDPKLFEAAKVFVKQHISQLCTSKEWLSLASEYSELAKRLLS